MTGCTAVSLREHGREGSDLAASLLSGSQGPVDFDAMVFWTIFAYSAIPAGALLNLLLLSEITFIMKVASGLMSTPVTIGNLRINVAVLVTVACLCLTLLSYSGFRREQMRTDQFSTQAAFIRDSEKPKLFYAERNFWISLLGLCLWSTAWRLEAWEPLRQC
eukprot:Skav211823  [mRNA]  locus=scaffold305:596583:597870:- [translate_table: standard]